MEWYFKVLKQYADFSGRARRKEYWMFTLFSFIITAIIGAIDNTLGTGFFSGLYALVMFIPHLAVSVRRLHDIGKSGWMLLVLFIPIVGIIWLLILHINEGDIGTNLYGEDPKMLDYGM